YILVPWVGIALMVNESGVGYVVVKLNFLVCLFFFSSRRRHTRSDRDWSSDVCSSDLSASRSPRTRSPRRSRCRANRDGPGLGRRSEERRVGKECRALWAPLY